MNSQFESGRHRAQKCSNIVVSEDCAPCWHETYNAMRTSKVIGPQPGEVDQMRCMNIQRICERRMSVQRNRAFPPNPKRNNYVNHIGREDEKGIRKACRKNLFHGWGAS